MLDNKFWDNYMGVFDVMGMVIPYKELVDRVCKELDIKNSDLILDAGSGTVALALEIKKRGGKVVGIDSSQAAIKIHKKKDMSAEIIFADLTKPFLFEDNYFDRVVCMLTLHSIKIADRQTLINEFYRVLKPGGKIVLANPCSGFNPSRIFWDHLRKDLKKSGIMKVLFDTVVKVGYMIKMFYYNIMIERENKKGEYGILGINEQTLLLKKSGFKNLSETEVLYAKSAILNSAYKK
jgi:ubiquinone/menaquinone biosynthesis C-methylase UbiE